VEALVDTEAMAGGGGGCGGKEVPAAQPWQRFSPELAALLLVCVADEGAREALLEGSRLVPGKVGGFC
jgi:hypothetical protein